MTRPEEAADPATPPDRLRVLFQQGVQAWEELAVDGMLPDHVPTDPHGQAVYAHLCALGRNPNLPRDLLFGNFAVDALFVESAAQNPALLFYLLDATTSEITGMVDGMLAQSLRQPRGHGPKEATRVLEILGYRMSRSTTGMPPAVLRSYVTCLGPTPAATGGELWACVLRYETVRRSPELVAYRKRAKIPFVPMTSADHLAPLLGLSLPPSPP